MAVTVRLQLAEAQLARQLTGPGGEVTRYVSGVIRKIENLARLYTPVDTGNLRASLTPAVRSEGARVIGTVGTAVEYALPVHEGVRAQQVTVKSHTVKAHKIKAHNVSARTQLTYTVPAQGGRAGYTVGAHLVRKHRVATRTQLTYTAPAHSRLVSAREGRPFLRRAMEEVSAQEG